LYANAEPDTDDEQMSMVAYETIANIITAVTRLSRLGAKKFMVGNAFDFASFPGFIREGVAGQASVYQTTLNAELPAKMEKLAKELGVEIDIFDYIAAGDRIRSDPDQVGLLNLTDPCTEHPIASGNICADPDEYYYWGHYYLTRVVHQAMGDAMAEQLSK